MKKDGLKSLVFDFEPKETERGRYIPYCDCRWHQGLVLDEEVCLVRRCKYYHMLFIDKKETKERIYPPKSNLPYND